MQAYRNSAYRIYWDIHYVWLWWDTNGTHLANTFTFWLYSYLLCLYFSSLSFYSATPCHIQVPVWWNSANLTEILPELQNGNSKSEKEKKKKAEEEIVAYTFRAFSVHKHSKKWLNFDCILTAF